MDAKGAMYVDIAHIQVNHSHVTIIIVNSHSSISLGNVVHPKLHFA